MQIAHLIKCTACLLLYSCSLHKPFLFIQGSLLTKNIEPTRAPLISSNKFDQISETILILKKPPGCIVLKQTEKFWFFFYFSPWRCCLITSAKALFGLLQLIFVKMEINGPNTKLTDCCHLFDVHKAVESGLHPKQVQLDLNAIWNLTHNCTYVLSVAERK